MKLITGTQIKEASPDGGKWFDFETVEGEKISVRLRFLNPKEKMTLNRFTYNTKDDEMSLRIDETYQKQIDIAKRSILDWKGLSDINGNELPFSIDMLKDDVFLGALYQIDIVGEKKLIPAICEVVTDPLAFYQKAI